MNGKRAEINNTSKHAVLVSSPLSVLSSFSLYCYSMASPRSAWHCMPALRALRSLARSSMLLTVLAPSWPFLAPSWDVWPVSASSWTVLAPSLHVLASSWAILAPSCAILAPSWHHLGPSWCHLGPSWAQLGLPKPLKIAPRPLQKPCFSLGFSMFL